MQTLITGKPDFTIQLIFDQIKNSLQAQMHIISEVEFLRQTYPVIGYFKHEVFFMS